MSNLEIKNLDLFVLKILLLSITICGCTGTSVYDLAFSGFACESKLVQYTCPADYVIRIVAVTHGRQDNQTCADDIPENKTVNTFCNVNGSDQVLKDLCDGKAMCSFYVDNVTFADHETDCLGVYTYIDVIYVCEANMKTVTGCESDKVSLSCPADTVIYVHNVEFGRNNDNITCQHGSILNTSCVSNDPGTQRLSLLCNGRQNCTFYAYSRFLGDPCPGTYKTVRVDYLCGSCSNLHDSNQCDIYESWGECGTNINWMNAYCRKSCWQCQYSGHCSNVYSSDKDCDGWAEVGECSTNPGWMNPNCRKSCNTCKGLWQSNPVKTTYTKSICEMENITATCDVGFSLRIDSFRFGRWSLNTCAHQTVNASTSVCYTGQSALNKTIAVCEGRRECMVEARTALYGDPCPGVFKQATLTYTCQDCKNALIDTECEKRKTAGECDTNNMWMLDNCFKSCTGCDVRECGNSYDETPGNVPTCDYWALRDECVKNEEHMKANCLTSCNLCHLQPPPVITTTPAPGAPVLKEICEGDFINMTCPAHMYIHLNSVFFGRLDNITCPHESIKTTDCVSPESALPKARAVCDGRNTCSFIADHRVWGDPCPGTYKAASVLYSCTECNNTASDSDCVDWAAEGRCTSDYNNMIEKCFKTCTKCENKGCGNNYQSSVDCDYWALRGQCDNFPDFMRENCQESCESCVALPEILPEESRSLCEKQSEQLNCPQNYHIELNDMFYGRVDNDSCEHSSIDSLDCDTPDGALDKLRALCDGRTTCNYEARSELWGDNCKATLKQANVTFTCHLCRNNATDLECSQWASQGKCVTDRPMMMEQCYQTCSGCLNKVCGNSHTSYLDCDYWALLGECNYNPGFMLNKCTESCHLCGGFSTTPAPTTNVTTPLHPDKLPAQKVTLCEKQVRHLDCPSDYHLRINTVFFGRLDQDTCPAGVNSNNTNCPSVPLLEKKARAVCDGRTSCWFEALSRIWGDNCPDTSKIGIAEYTCQLCQNGDSTTSCEQRKSEGKCVTEYDAMMDQCFLTCSQCDRVCSNTYNSSIDCDYWALIGECRRNPTYMLSNCQQACKSCNTTSLTTTTVSPTTGTPPLYSCAGRNNCSGHGRCVGQDLCSCAYGWHGLNCESFNCWDDYNCFGNGWCYGPNQCFCDAYYSGRSCNQCTVTFQITPTCLPCPPCVHGICVDSQEDTLTNSSYIGCFKDSVSDRDLPYFRETSAITNSMECVSHCHMLGYLYAGVQNGDQCYCGNSYGKHGTADTCDSVCSKSGDKCGGNTANSVWRTYQGRCECDQGWSGSLCSECVGAGCTTTVLPQTTVIVAVILQLDWKQVYADTTADETKQFYSNISTYLLKMYQSISTSVLAVHVKRLRQGSVIVEHEVVMSGQLDSIAQEQFKCSIYDNLLQTQNISPDIQANSDTTLDQLCSWRTNYCKNNGELLWVSDKWVCRCPDNFKGDFCEDSHMDRTVLIVIIVASCVVAIIVISVIIVACVRKASSSSPATSDSTAGGAEAYTMENDTQVLFPEEPKWKRQLLTSF